jgi:hypothetical protein
MFKVNADTKIVAVSRELDLGENAKLKHLPNGELVKQLRRGDKLNAIINIKGGETYSVWYEVKDYTKETDTLELNQLLLLGPYIPPAVLQLPNESLN